MLDAFIVVCGVVLASALAVIGVGRLIEDKDRNNESVYKRLFFQEIERRSPRLHDLIANRSRKLNETEEGWVYSILKEKYGIEAREELLRFKKGVLDECTEKPDYGRLSSASRQYRGKPFPFKESPNETYERAQKEINEAEETLINSRVAYAKKNITPLPEKMRGLDAINDSDELRIQKISEKIKRQPYANITRNEAIYAISKIEDEVSRGLVSPEIAEGCEKRIKKSAGILRETKTTVQEGERADNIARSNEAYIRRMKRKEKEGESRFMGPTKGRAIAEDEHESIYRKIKRFFSRG